MTSDSLGSIPPSTALSEASPMSLQEEFSRDPEQYQQQNLDFIISEMRELRKRLEASAEVKPVRAAKPPATTINFAADLGL